MTANKKYYFNDPADKYIVSAQLDLNATISLEGVVDALNTQRKAICASRLQRAAAKTYIANVELSTIADSSKSRRGKLKELLGMVKSEPITQEENIKLATEIDALKARRDAIYDRLQGGTPPPPPRKITQKKKSLSAEDLFIHTKMFTLGEQEAEVDKFIDAILGASDGQLQATMKDGAKANNEYKAAIQETKDNGARIQQLKGFLKTAASADKRNEELKDERDAYKQQIKNLMA